MPKILFGLCLILLAFFACKKESSAESKEITSESVLGRLIKTEKPISKLNPKSASVVSEWPEYQNYKEAVEQYQEITMSDALLNSVDLALLSQQLKDSIRIEKIDTPAVRIRLNVIHNHSLRLSDMSTIPTITEEEVAEANNDVVDAFSALNLKLNNMIRKESLNSDISRFIDEVVKENDTTRSDSIGTVIPDQNGSDPGI